MITLELTEKQFHLIQSTIAASSTTSEDYQAFRELREKLQDTNNSQAPPVGDFGEPWKSTTFSVAMIISADYLNILESCPIGKHASASLAVSSERAQRAVACVNACKGLDPAHIPALMVAAMGVLATVRCELDLAIKDLANLNKALNGVMGKE